MIESKCKIKLVKTYRNSWRVFWSVLFFCMLVISRGVVASEAQVHVLVIDSSHMGDKTEESRLRAFLDKLEHSNSRFETTVVRLDAKRIASKTYRHETLKILLEQYPEGYFNLIVVKGDSALSTVYSLGADMFYGAPLVFFDVKFYDKTRYQNSTGIIKSTYLYENLELALRLFPDIKSVAVVTDDSYLEGRISDKIKAELQNNSNLSAIYLNGDELPVEELEERLLRLPKDSIVFFDSWGLDPQGNDSNYNIDKSLKKIFTSLNSPVFVNSKSYMELGATAGVYQGTSETINTICDSIIPQIISGEKSAGEIRIINDGGGVTGINIDSLSRSNADFSVLDKSMEVYGEPKDTPYKKGINKEQIRVLYKPLPPLVWTDSNKQPKGALVDIWRLWAKNANVEVRFVEATEEDKRDTSTNACVWIGESSIVNNDSQIYDISEINPLLLTTASIYYSSHNLPEYDWKGYRDSKVAIVKNESFERFLTNTIPGVTVVSYDSTEEILQSMDAGEFDIFFMEDIVAEVALANEGIEHRFISNKFCSIKIKVAPKLCDHKLGQTNDSSKKIAMINKSFSGISFETLFFVFSKYSTDQIAILPLFTPDELLWKENHGNIKIGVVGKTGDVEQWNNKSAVGLVPDVLRSIMQSQELSVEFVRLPNITSEVESLKEGIVNVLAFYNSKSKEKLLFSSPYLKLPIVALSRDRTSYFGDMKSTVVVPSNYTGYYYHLKDKYLGNSFVLVESTSDAVDMVKNNSADIAIIDQINADAYKESVAYNSMHTSIQYSMVLNFSLALLDTSQNRILLSIINKIVLTTPKQVVNSYINKYSAKRKISLSLAEIFLFVGPWIIGITIVGFLLWGYTTRKTLIKLHKSEENLKNEKTWLNATMRSIGEGVIATDVQGKIVQMNTVAEELIQCAESQAVGRFTSDVYLLYNSNFKQNERNPVTVALEKKQVVDLQQNIVLVNSANAEIPITATAAPILDSDNGVLLGAVFVFKDVRAEAIYRRQLTKTKAFLSNAIELAGVSYFTYDINANKVIISSGKRESHLYVDKDNLNLSDILPDIIDEDLDKIKELWDQLLDLRINKFRANYKVSRGGEIRFKRVDVRSEVDNSNKLVRAFGVRLDVTDIIYAENVARQRLEQAYDLAKLLYYEYSPLTDRVVSNEKLNDMFMVKPENPSELSLDDIFKYVVVEDKEKIKEAIFKTRNNIIDDYEQEVRVVKSGKQNILKIFTNNNYNDAGQWIGSTGCVLDITELNYVQKELEVSEEQKRLILGSIKESVVYINRDLELVWANESTYAMFECEELEALSVQYNNIVYGEDSPNMMCNTVSVIRGSSDTLIENLNFRGKELLVSLNPIRDRVGNVTHVVKTFSDISEFKEIQNNLREAYERAETANKAKSTFLSTMTHEIRTPLNAIIGFSGLLQYEDLDAKATSYARSINTAATGLLSLINNVLDYSRLEANKMTLNFQTVKIHDLLHEVEILFTEKAKAKQISLVITYGENIPPLTLDKERLRQVLINIIGNAIKFTNFGSIHVKAKFTAIESNVNGLLSISITDTGIGIASNDQQRMFESFEQQESSSTRKYDGTGLGLSISKSLVELMNGEISLSSEVGVGSEFTVTLRDVQCSSSLPVENEQETKSFGVFEEERVLLVSKDQNDLTVVTSMLHRMGLQCETTSSTSDAIEIVNEEKFKLIITSIFEKDTDSASLCEQIFSNASLANIPIIALTGYSDPKEHFDTSGFAEIIVKPITVEKFSETIGKFMNRIEELKTRVALPENTDDKVEDLSSEVVEEVLEKFEVKFEEMIHGVDIEHAKEISSELIGFATNHGNQLLINIAKKLDQYVATYKLPDMMYIVKLFLKHKD